jgi:hypothetical protein
LNALIAHDRMKDTICPVGIEFIDTMRCTG